MAVASVHSSVSQSSLAGTVPSSSAASVIDQSTKDIPEQSPTPTKTPTKTERRVTLGVLESGKFRLSKDFVGQLVRSTSTTSRRNPSPLFEPATHGPRALGFSEDASEDELNSRVDNLDTNTEARDQQMTTTTTNTSSTSQSHNEHLQQSRPPSSAKAKIYEFFSRPSSRSQSRTNTSTSLSSAHEPPTISSEPEPSITLNPTPLSRPNPSKPSTRSPSRPISSTTATTEKTIRQARAHTPPDMPTPPSHRHWHPDGHQPQPSSSPDLPPQYQSPYLTETTPSPTPMLENPIPVSVPVSRPATANGTGAVRGHNHDPYAYDPRMLPPPVPSSAHKKKPPPTLFGISFGGSRGTKTAPNSMPTTPKKEREMDEMGYAISTPQSPRGRSGGRSGSGSGSGQGKEKAGSGSGSGSGPKWFAQRIFSPARPSRDNTRAGPSFNPDTGIISPLPRSATATTLQFPPSTAHDPNDIDDSHLPGRSHSSPPRVRSPPATATVIPAGVTYHQHPNEHDPDGETRSTRSGRCSPLGMFGPRRLFRGGKGSRNVSKSRSRPGSSSNLKEKGKEKESDSRPGTGKEKEKEKDGRPVVSVPMLRTRTHSKEGQGGATDLHRRGSLDYERGSAVGSRGMGAPGPIQMSRSASQGGASRSKHHQSPRPGPGVNGAGSGPSSSYHRPQHNQTHPQAHARTHHLHPPHPHLHSAPHSPQSPLFAVHNNIPPGATTSTTTHASGHSHSTNGTSHTGHTGTNVGSTVTAAAGTTAGATAGGGGSWGRRARLGGWVSAGVHPPFEFESAVSASGGIGGTGVGRVSPGGAGTGGGGKTSGRVSPVGAVSEGRGRVLKAKQQQKEKERSPLGSGGAGSGPSGGGGGNRVRPRTRSGGRDVRIGIGGGGGERKEIELGLGLTWAPSKIKVREWSGSPTPTKPRPPAPSSAPGSPRLAGMSDRERRDWEMGRLPERDRNRGLGPLRRDRDDLRAGRRERDVTGRFREVLGERGFESFRKYVRRYDADLITLDGSDGLLVKVKKLLDTAPAPSGPGTGISEWEKRELLNDLVRIVRETEY
ncbi:uncharacterized protein STEHIDRAFT_120159 [Stereum hirsutum FP-91666 SS1]|uniref:uncharacterized protein n=1 Tax=Stereum hirsutum (strain FP-91666) TaxID=721885 RepID=UPI000440BD8C|nr:uncharacterized protein STEHIDRAFT_120159 [Stereum hirsutum FP-91666 SS1]EIM87931.1 hypothetical protein STEHIDRAFT_120159 [Stereum hirsutum FP-91666 SS1]